MKGKIDGLAIRVPTPNVSVVDLVCELEKSPDPQEVNEAFKKASQGVTEKYSKIVGLDIIEHIKAVK